MKLDKKTLRKLILQEMASLFKSNNTILEMNLSDRKFAAAQRAYDNMQPPGFDINYDESDSVFDYAFEELIEYLVEAAEDEGLLFYDDTTQIVTDRSGHQVGHYVGTEFYVDDEQKLIEILKSNFNPDLYVDSYATYQERLAADDARDAMELERDIRASEYDGDY